ncbi:MAG: adenylosuccinate lyase [Candidatus Micrarchaeota archaeon]
MSVSPIEERYRTEMNDVFEDKSVLRKWLQVEVALANAHARIGHITKENAIQISKAAKRVRLSRVKQIESQIHHDLMAMVKALTEACSKDSGAHVHLGATSYDIEDTATALLLRDAFAILWKRAEELKHILIDLAKRHKRTVCIGRTHGQHAVPTTYGLKFALYATEIDRHLSRIEQAEKRLYVGKMTGAVGTMATFGEDAFRLQEYVMEELGLHPPLVTNQVIQRDRHAEAMFILSLIACSLEKIAKEIRNLQRTEISEIAEPFGKKQVGSSTMPQKRNPHKSERICGLARVVRANLQVSMENISLEHERDLTNSASERVIISQSFILVDYMLSQMIGILSGIEFFKHNIQRNLHFTGGLVMAERMMIALTEAGMGRQEAHALVRKASIHSLHSGKHLKQVLSKDKQVRKLLTVKKLSELFNEESYVGKAFEIVDRVIEKSVE